MEDKNVHQSEVLFVQLKQFYIHLQRGENLQNEACSWPQLTESTVSQFRFKILVLHITSKV